MTKAAVSNGPLTKTNTDFLADLAAVTDVPKKQVANVLGALAAEVKRSLIATGAITILELVKIEKKTVPACPTWPAYVKVTVAHRAAART